MACGSCTRRKPQHKGGKYDVMGGYKTLTARQINARLEVYKKMYCSDCVNRYNCDFGMYSACTKKDEVK